MVLAPCTAPKVIELPESVPLTVPFEMQVVSFTVIGPETALPVCWKVMENVPVTAGNFVLCQVPLQEPAAVPSPPVPPVGLACWEAPLVARGAALFLLHAVASRVSARRTRSARMPHSAARRVMVPGAITRLSGAP